MGVDVSASELLPRTLLDGRRRLGVGTAIRNSPNVRCGDCSVIRNSSWSALTSQRQNCYLSVGTAVGTRPSEIDNDEPAHWSYDDPILAKDLENVPQ